MKKKIFIIAGEPSGDVIGGKLIAAIKLINPEIEFVGVGGKNMQEQGLKSLFPISELSIMGFAEILPHIPKLLKRIKETSQEIINSEAEMVITIDSPDFCFRVIKKTQHHQIKKAHLIAPSVWAYRPKRAQKISKIYDLLLAILPFEPPYFEKHGLKTVFIGHPIMEGNYNPKEDEIEKFRQQYKIKASDLVICATSGSRCGEVKRILPEIISAANILAKKYPNLTVILPVIEKTKDLTEENLGKFSCKTIIVSEKQKYLAFKVAKLAIAKSGTNNLEIAICE
ncbi:MAG: lipid-A-disaccharide synthase, partial [Lentimonas sp.]